MKKKTESNVIFQNEMSTERERERERESVVIFEKIALNAEIPISDSI